MTEPTLYARLGGRDTLRRLLRHFYADVRQHQLIGPIFTRHISDWPTHLEKIANFWSTVTGGPVVYAGPVYPVHRAMPLEPTHYAAWLELWTRHCRIHAPADAAEDLIAFAQNFARRLSRPANPIES